MPGNLGFDTWLVADACFTFAEVHWCGTARSAEQIQAMSLANPDGEFRSVTTTAALLGDDSEVR